MEENANLKNDQFRKAYAAAIAILSIRDHSKYELKKKIISKGFDESVSESVILRLVETGYLKDGDLAQRFACSMLEKGSGRFRIKMKLNEKGFDEKDSEIALEACCSYDQELFSAFSAASKKMKSLNKDDSSKIRVKLSRFLVSRGFDYEITRDVVNRLMDQVDNR